MPILDTRRGLQSLSFWILTLFLAASPLLAQNGQTLGWIEAINQALQANQSLAAAQEDLQAKREDISIAKANFFPRFSVSGAFGEAREETFGETSGIIPASSGTIGANFSQMIYDQKSFANHSIQEDLFASQEEQVRNTRFNIISDTGQAYVSVLLAEDLLQVQISNRDLTEQNLEISVVREEVGAASLQQVLRWRTQLYSNEQDVVEQRTNILAGRLTLNQVRYRPAEELYTLERLNVEKNGFIFSSDVVAEALSDPDKARVVRDYLVELAVSNSPLIPSLDREIAAQQRSLNSDRRWLIPSFSFAAAANASLYASGEGSDRRQEDKGWWAFGVTVNWPIFNGGGNLAEVHQASAELRALQFQRRELVSSLEQAVRTQAGFAIADFQKITFATAQADAARQNYILVDDSYLLGEISLLDLLDAQSEVLAASSSQTVALYTFLADLLSLEQSMGYFHFLEPQNQVDTTVQALETRLR